MEFRLIRFCCQWLAVCIALAPIEGVQAQLSTTRPGSGEPRVGSGVPAEVDTMYERGLAYLAQVQGDDGNWLGEGNPGITGICLMAFLASGEDPNFGRYQRIVRNAIRALIVTQDADTGYFTNSMYHHGFAMLALAEAYGAFDETRLWDADDSEAQKRSIAEALQLGIQSAIQSQEKNPWGAWRYSPQSKDADTSVSGAVLMGMLAARNAGIEVPDAAIETALTYFRKNTAESGMVAYSGFGGMGESMNRSSIATLIYSVGKKREWDEFGATLKYISENLEHVEQSHPNYFRYYMAQALFQGNFEAWQKWNGEIIRQLKNEQQNDGSFVGTQGPEYGTAMSLLALALNYRFLPIYER